ncbi:MAG: hypothetical protein WAT92_09845, partial [Saprospiraceae bacterium]
TSILQAMQQSALFCIFPAYLFLTKINRSIIIGQYGVARMGTINQLSDSELLLGVIRILTWFTEGGKFIFTVL